MSLRLEICVKRNSNEKRFLIFIWFLRQQEEYLRRTLDYSEDSTQPVSANSSVSEGPTSPLVVENAVNSMEADAKHSQEVESLKRLLQEVMGL